MARMALQPEGGAALVVDLLDDQLPHVAGQGVQRVHLVGDGGRVGEQTVQRDQGDHRREDGQEAEEGDAGPQQGHLVGLRLGPAPFDDLKPALGRDLGGLLGLLTPGTPSLAVRFASSTLESPWPCPSFDVPIPVWRLHPCSAHCRFN